MKILINRVQKFESRYLPDIEDDFKVLNYHSSSIQVSTSKLQACTGTVLVLYIYNPAYEMDTITKFFFLGNG